MLAALSTLFVALQAQSPQVDRIRLAPPTGIYVETDRSGNDGRPECDWYASAATLLRAADELEVRPLDCQLSIRIRGVLNEAGAARFAALTDLLAAADSVPTGVVLNSRGGDALAAFRIAELMRRHPLYRRTAGGVTTSLDPSHSAVCFSACLIVFAAGFERVAEFDIDGDAALPSRLGIHSPAQFDRTASHYDTAQDNRSIRIVRERLVQYFRSVGVSERIVDDMFAVPFDEIRLLTKSEAADYGLVGGPPRASQ